MPQFLPGRSYIYSGNINKNELKLNNVDLIDLIEVDVSHINVKELRETLSLANQKALGGNRLLWLKNFDGVSEIFQNTLLKIVEEPPEGLIIILQTANSNNLLATLRSRLHIVKQKEEKEVKTGERFPSDLKNLEKILRDVKDREGLYAILLEQLNFLKEEILRNPSERISKQIELLNRAARQLKQNGNQKLVI